MAVIREMLLSAGPWPKAARRARCAKGAQASDESPFCRWLTRQSFLNLSQTVFAEVDLVTNEKGRDPERPARSGVFR